MNGQTERLHAMANKDTHTDTHTHTHTHTVGEDILAGVGSVWQTVRAAGGASWTVRVLKIQEKNALMLLFLHFCSLVCFES